jgi:hypothetical protein
MTALLLHERYDAICPTSFCICCTLSTVVFPSVPRSVLTPQDAQCWRRLATIYGQIGQEALAKQAHYTAWQLGIGQGGFGGPR